MAVDRHLNYFELQKACAKPGCPLCSIVSARADRYMDNLLFEHVSDRGFRASYRAAGGFCDFHARNLTGYRDGLAVAILGRDILEDRIAAFKKRAKWKPRDRCPVCLERERIEREYLTFLAQADADGRGGATEAADELELRAAFESSEGLCAPHYGLLLEVAKRVPSWLSAYQERKFDALMKRASDFIEYSAYGRQEDFAKLSEADQVVWKELAASLRGSCS